MDREFSRQSRQKRVMMFHLFLLGIPYAKKVPNGVLDKIAPSGSSKGEKGDLTHIH